MDIFFKSSGLLVFLITLIWVLPWKGYALWTAAKKSNKWWFVALLIVNTFAILEIIYIFFVAKKTGRDVKADLKAFFSSAKKAIKKEKSAEVK
jgi:hypothetical protein